MSLDITKLQFISSRQTYKNNARYTGSYSISGSTVSGVNLKSTSITLDKVPDLVDITFNGPSGGAFSISDPRPDNAWFKAIGGSRGVPVYVRGDNSGAGYNNYGTMWYLSTSLVGAVLTINMVWVQQFTAGLTLTSTPIYYRVIDYSIS